MSKRGIRKRALHAAAAIAVGGSVFQLGGCDPTVRATLLAGLSTTTQALAQTLITTFFQSLANDSTGGGLTTT